MLFIYYVLCSFAEPADFVSKHPFPVILVLESETRRPVRAAVARPRRKDNHTVRLGDRHRATTG